MLLRLSPDDVLQLCCRALAEEAHVHVFGHDDLISSYTRRPVVDAPVFAQLLLSLQWCYARVPLALRAFFVAPRTHISPAVVPLRRRLRKEAESAPHIALRGLLYLDRTHPRHLRQFGNSLLGLLPHGAAVHILSYLVLVTWFPGARVWLGGVGGAVGGGELW